MIDFYLFINKLPPVPTGTDPRKQTENRCLFSRFVPRFQAKSIYDFESKYNNKIIIHIIFDNFFQAFPSRSKKENSK